MNKSLLNFSTLTFDCYGTLIDWETGIWDALQPLLASNRVDWVTREKALVVYAEAESHQQDQTPDLYYPALLSRVHEAIAEAFELQSSEALNREFGQSVHNWPAFPDTADALRILSRHYRLVILSNIHIEGITASCRKLGVDFDAVYTAEDIGSYKPSDRNFEYMLEHLKTGLKVDKEEVLHTAQSLFHDHVPARRFGLSNAWIDRQRLLDRQAWGATMKVEELPEYDFRFVTLDSMAEAVQREASSVR